ncbi:MAG: hypothetical protein FWF79_03580 [Defluviitaleaceae bacterium]|nr:hypothetical protein [Defluviitaleaceae bacterium]
MGTRNRSRDIEDAGQDTAETYINAFDNAAGIRSPSTVMREKGENLGEGLIRGTQDIQPRVEDTATTLARAFVNAVAGKINSSQEIDNATRRQIEDMRRTADSAVMAMHFDSIGAEMANGVARGIQNNSGIVSNAAQNMINNALNSMRAAAAIASPSRKTREIGQQLIDGITGGMDSKRGELERLCGTITKKVIDSLTIDPAEIRANIQDVLQSYRAAMPALESNIRYAAQPQPAFAHNRPPTQITVDMTRGKYSINIVYNNFHYCN